jgi:hypothetical protein
VIGSPPYGAPSSCSESPRTPGPTSTLRAPFSTSSPPGAVRSAGAAASP